MLSTGLLLLVLPVLPLTVSTTRVRSQYHSNDEDGRMSNGEGVDQPQPYLSSSSSSSYDRDDDGNDVLAQAQVERSRQEGRTRRRGWVQPDVELSEESAGGQKEEEGSEVKGLDEDAGRGTHHRSVIRRGRSRLLRMNSRMTQEEEERET